MELQELKALFHFFLERAQDYFCSSSGVEYVLSLCKITERPAVSLSALYTLAMATEGNGEFYEGKKHMYINLKQLLPHIQLVKLYDKQKSNSFCMRYVVLNSVFNRRFD